MAINTREQDTFVHMTFKRLALAIAAAGMVTLYGCGGGGGDSPVGAAPAVAGFSGVAAAGLPLVGTVTVKDANGVSRATPIGEGGSYSVDVTGLTGPFMFRAEGTVGGRSYIIHSAASAADTNGTINITPLTDLIVSNIAGQLAANYFNSGNFSTLTRSELDAETASLKAKLLPVLQAMGVDASIDLMRTAFTPLSSALDKALDVLSVSIDPATNVATITNLVTQQTISDDLATKAAAEAALAPLPGAGMTSAADDIPAIRKAITDIGDKFTAGQPLAAALLPLLHDTTDLPFRYFDMGKTGFADEVTQIALLYGTRFTDVAINRIDYTTASPLGGGADVYPRAYVTFNARNATGAVVLAFSTVQVAKGADGVWRLRGDGRRLDIYGQAHIVKDGVRNCVSTGLEFGVQDRSSNNNGTGFQYVIVTGPGLPVDGLKYANPGNGDEWTIQGGPQDGRRNYVLASSCTNDITAGLSDAQLAAIPDNAKYTFTPYSSDGVRTLQGPGNQGVSDADRQFSYNEIVPGRPLTMAEAAVTAFPSVTTSSPLASYNGGSQLTISASNILPSGAWIYLGLTDSLGQVRSSDTDVAFAAGGNVSASLALSEDGAVTHREIRVETRDTKWRALMTVLNYF